VRAEELDARTDLFSFGLVLYEMATGRRAFAGDSPGTIFDGILHKVPTSPVRLNPDCPAELEHIINKALEKDREVRYQSASELRADLKRLKHETEAARSAGVSPAVAAIHELPPRRWWPALATGATLVAAIAVLIALNVAGLRGRISTAVRAGGAALVTHWAGVLRLSPASSQTPVYATIPLQAPQVVAGGQYAHFAISPNGRLIVLRQDSLLSIRQLDSFSATAIDGTNLAAFPTFSPDGSALAFQAAGRIKRVGVFGGPIAEVAAVRVGGGIAWGEDNWIYFSAGLGTGGIWRVPAEGGKAEAVTQVDDAAGENAHTWPQLLPGGKALLFIALGPSAGSEDSRIVVQLLQSKKRKTIVEKAIFGRYLPTGHLIYATNAGIIYALPFDPARLETTGKPVPVLSDVGTATWGGAAFLAASDNGTLIFLRPTQRQEFVFRAVGKNGSDTGTSFVFDSKTMAKIGPNATDLCVSPDGKRFAFTGRSPGTNDVWILDARVGEAERLTFDPAEDEFPVWSPDGRAVAYSSAQTGTTRRIFIKSIESGTQPKLVRTWPRHIHVSSWSPDGRWLAAYDYTPTNATDIWVIPVEGKDAIAVANGPAFESGAVFSPDGRWIAYDSTESGQGEVYVVSFPGLESRRQMSTDGGTRPRWDPQGHTLYYLQNGYLVAQEVSTRGELSKGRSKRLFATQAIDFQVAPGGRFVLTEPNSQPADSPLHLIANWFPELKPLCPTGK